MRLLVSGGGTAGGVFPALAAVAELEGRAEVLWVGGAGGMERRLVGDLPYREIPAAGVHGVGLAALPGNLATLARGYGAARTIVNEFRPEAMLLTGGYVGVPTALAGRSVPQVAFVPDLSPGLALQAITRLARTVAVSAPAARQDYGRRKVIVTGYPTRRELRPIDRAEARRSLELDPERAVVLGMGGSRGARSVNEALWLSLPGLLDVAQVVHITGELDWPRVEAVVAELPERLAGGYHPHTFLLDELAAAYSAADLVVSRAGASTLGEYPLFGLPALLVPYPHAWRYQSENADYLVSQGGAIKIEDKQIRRALLPAVRGLLQDSPRLSEMGRAMQALARPGAAKALADEVLAVAG